MKYLDNHDKKEYNNYKMQLQNAIKENCLKLAHIYNGNIRVEANVNPKVQSVKLKVTEMDI